MYHYLYGNKLYIISALCLLLNVRYILDMPIFGLLNDGTMGSQR